MIIVVLNPILVLTDWPSSMNDSHFALGTWETKIGLLSSSDFRITPNICYACMLGLFSYKLVV